MALQGPGRCEHREVHPATSNQGSMAGFLLRFVLRRFLVSSTSTSGPNLESLSPPTSIEDGEADSLDPRSQSLPAQ